MGNITTSFKVTWVNKTLCLCGTYCQSYSRSFRVQIDKDEIEDMSQDEPFDSGPSLPAPVYHLLSTRFFDTLDILFPDFDSKLYTLAHIDEYGHRFLIKYRHSPDLEAIVEKKKGVLLGAAIIHLQIEERENVERSIADALFGTRDIETCIECGGNGGRNAMFIYCHKCGPEYILCSPCYASGHSSQHGTGCPTESYVDVKKVMKEWIPEKKVVFAFIIGMSFGIMLRGLKNLLFKKY